MSEIPEAIKASLPKMDDAAPMAQGVQAEGALAEATRNIAHYVQKLSDEVPKLMRSGHDSKRVALLKAIQLLTNEFPPPQTSPEVSDQVAAAAQGQQQQPPGGQPDAAAMLASQQPQGEQPGAQS